MKAIAGSLPFDGCRYIVESYVYDGDKTVAVCIEIKSRKHVVFQLKNLNVIEYVDIVEINRLLNG